MVAKLFNKIPLISLLCNAAYDFIAVATASAQVVHIVDFTSWTGSWAPLLRSYAEAPNRNLLVKMTIVEPPPGLRWGMGPCIPGIALQSQIMKLAGELGLEVQFRTVVSRQEDLTPAILQLDERDALVVSGFLFLQHLPDASVVRSNPRDKFLKVKHVSL